MLCLQQQQIVTVAIQLLVMAQLLAWAEHDLLCQIVRLVQMHQVQQQVQQAYLCHDVLQHLFDQVCQNKHHHFYVQVYNDHALSIHLLV
ncbi:hypothetical protein BDF19DRAFT_184891 [Syncephalis fuscata]|nr:hypothetical protein BDF19DRAFT_184891 [Syncephalis fuscata]